MPFDSETGRRFRYLMKLEAIDDPSDELRESVYVHLREYNQRMNATAWAARDLPENAAKAVTFSPPTKMDVSAAGCLVRASSRG